MDKLRIIISGPSGAGKTTLAKRLEMELGIPFVTMSTKPMWKEWGISSHKDIINRSLSDPLWGYKFQCAVLDQRLGIMEANPRMISDRGAIDVLTYYMMQSCHNLSNLQNNLYLEGVTKLHSLADLTVLLPPLKGPIEDDGMRVNNQMYSDLTYTIMQDIATRLLSDNTHIAKLKIDSVLNRTNFVKAHLTDF